MDPHLLITIEQVFQLALELEQYLQTPTFRRVGLSLGNNVTRRISERDPITAPSATQGSNSVSGPIRDKGKGIAIQSPK